MKNTNTKFTSSLFTFSVFNKNRRNNYSTDTLEQEKKDRPFDRIKTNNDISMGRNKVFNSVLSDIKLKLNNKETIINEDTQLELEKIVRKQFLDFAKVQDKSNTKIFRSINLDVLTPKIQEILVTSLDKFRDYITAFKRGLYNEIKIYLDNNKDNDLDELKNNSHFPKIPLASPPKKKQTSLDDHKKLEDKLKEFRNLEYSKILLEHHSVELLARYCISYYLRIVSGIRNNDFNFLGYLNSSTNLVKFIGEFYFNSLYQKYLADNPDIKKTYSQWFNDLDGNIKYIEDNLFRLYLGQRLMGISSNIGLLSMSTASATELVIKRDKEVTEYV